MQKLKIQFSKNKIIAAKEEKTGKDIPLKSIKGKKYFLDALSHKDENIEVRYNHDGLPVRITNKTDKQKVGGKFFIDISHYQCK
jgi:hypothetical protein